MKAHLIYPASLLLFFVVACSSSKTTPKAINEITRKVESKDFTVEMNYANPLRGKHIYLTSGYDLCIKNDSAFAYLPYYGVAYTAPYNSSDGGIKFAEPMSDYVMTPHKKADGWDIRFKVNSRSGVYNLALNVFNNGSTTLSVESYERDMIRFDGMLKTP